jgi:phage-related protein
LKSLNAETSKLNQRLGGTNKQGSNLSQTANALTNMSDEVTDGIRQMGKGLSKVNGDLEKSSENTRDFGIATNALNKVLQGTTVNIGAFNLQLKNLVVTLPIVTGLIGTLTTTLAGLLTGLAGIAGFLGAGIFAGFAQDLADIRDNSAEIDSLFGAMEEKMSRLKDAVVEATGPLQQEVFQKLTDEIGSGLLWALEQFSIQVARSVDLIFALKDAIATPFGNNWVATLEALRNSTERLLPIIEGIAKYIARSIPEFMRWSSKQTLRLSDSIGNLITSFIKFAKQATELTVTLLNGLLPVITPLIDIFTGFLDIINKIPSSTLELVVKIGAFALILEYLLKKLTESDDLLGSILDIVEGLGRAQSDLTGELKRQIGVWDSYTEKLEEVKELYKDLKFAQENMKMSEAKPRLSKQLEENQGVNEEASGGIASGLLSASALYTTLSGFTSLSSPASMAGSAVGGASVAGGALMAGGDAGFAIGSLMSKIPSLTGIFSSLSSVLGSVIPSLSSLLSILTSAVSLLLSPITAIVLAVVAVVDAFDLLAGSLGFLVKIGRIVIGIVDILGSVFSIIFSVLRAVVAMVRTAINVIGNFIMGILQLDHVMNFIWGILNAVIHALQQFGKWIDSIAQKAHKWSLGIIGKGKDIREKSEDKSPKAPFEEKINSESATSTKKAKSDTSAEGMKRGDTYVEQEYNVENNVNQNVQDPDLTSKQKRVLNDMMRQFRQEAQNEATGG